MDTQKSINLIAKGALIFLLGTILTKFLSYLFRVIIARLGPEDYGLISLGIAIFGIISVVCVFGFDTGLYGLISSMDKTDRKKIHGLVTSASQFSLLLSIVFGFLLFLLSETIATMIFHAQGLTIVLKVVAIALPFGVVRAIFQAGLRAFQLVKHDTYSLIADNVTKLIFALIFLYLGIDVFGVALAYLFGALVSFLVALILFQKKVFPILTKEFRLMLVNWELLAYSWPLLLNSISMMILAWTDIVMLGFFRTATEVGLYNTAAPTASLMSVLNKSVMAIFLPVTAALYLEKKQEELSAVYKTTVRWIFTLNSFPLLLLVLFPAQILGTFFGAEYSSAYAALAILATFFLFSSIADVPRDILLMVKKPKTIFHITLIGVVANIVLNIFLIPQYGFVGAAIATGASFLVTTVLFFVAAYRDTKIFAFDGTVVKILLATSLVIGLITILKDVVNVNTITGLIALTMLTIFLHMFALWALGCIKKEELVAMRAGLKRIKHIGNGL